MDSLPLLKTQKNELFEMIRAHGLNPSDFHWGLVQSHYASVKVSLIVHVPTGFYCLFDLRQERYYLTLSPGENTAIEDAYPESWHTAKRYLGQWLTQLTKQVAAPDFWAAIAQETALTDAATSESDPNLPFTPPEKERIYPALEEIKQYLLSIPAISSTHAEFVDNRFGYLRQALQRLGRIDWLHVLVSNLVGIALRALLPADACRDLFRFAADALRDIGRLLPGSHF